MQTSSDAARHRNTGKIRYYQYTTKVPFCKGFPTILPHLRLTKAAKSAIIQKNPTDGNFTGIILPGMCRLRKIFHRKDKLYV